VKIFLGETKLLLRIILFEKRELLTPQES